MHVAFWYPERQSDGLILGLLVDCPFKLGEWGSVYNDFEIHITKNNGTQHVLASAHGSPVICRLALDISDAVKRGDDGCFELRPPDERTYRFHFDMSNTEHESMYPFGMREVRSARFVEATA